MPDNERYNYFSMFTPEGKVLPIESIHRSVEHGNVCVALRNKETALMIAQRGRTDELFSENRKKIQQLDAHLAYTFSGVTNDGVKIGARIKQEIEAERERTGARLPFAKLFENIQFEYGLEIMRYGQRAMGIAGIIMGIDCNSLSLMELSPTGEVTACFASCIGRRSQSARTVLDNKNVSLLDLGNDALVRLGMDAFANAVNDPAVLTNEFVDVCVISLRDRSLTFPQYADMRAPSARRP